MDLLAGFCAGVVTGLILDRIILENLASYLASGNYRGTEG